MDQRTATTATTATAPKAARTAKTAKAVKVAKSAGIAQATVATTSAVSTTTTSGTSSFPRTIGIDLSARKSSFCVVDVVGVAASEGTIAMDRGSIDSFLSAQPPSRVVLEACTSARWVSQIATARGHEVVVANPRSFKVISASVRKSDRNDARMLAEFGQIRPHLLNPVILRGGHVQSARSVLIARDTLVSNRTAIINCARGLLRDSGYELPRCAAERFHVRVRQLIPSELAPAVLPLLDALEGLAKCIKQHDATIDRLAEEQFPETALLRQVSGVGPITALGFAVTIGDPSRFPRSRDVGAYFGLTPRSYASGDKKPELSISKCGDRLMRRLLVGAASYILRKGSPDTDLKRWGQAIRTRGGQAAKAKARAAVARKLAVLLHRLWVTGEVYRPLRAAQPQAA
jgi:transposase